MSPGRVNARSARTTDSCAPFVIVTSSGVTEQPERVEVHVDRDPVDRPFDLVGQFSARCLGNSTDGPQAVAHFRLGRRLGGQFANHVLVAERMHLAGNLLARFMALAGNQQDVATAQRRHGRRNGPGAIPGIYGIRAARHDLLANGRRFLAARGRFVLGR